MVPEHLQPHRRELGAALWRALQVGPRRGHDQQGASNYLAALVDDIPPNLKSAADAGRQVRQHDSRGLRAPTKEPGLGDSEVLVKNPAIWARTDAALSPAGHRGLGEPSSAAAIWAFQDPSRLDLRGGIKMATLRADPQQPLTMKDPQPLVGIIMGSQSDWPTLEHAAQTLTDFDVSWEAEVVSAHRTPRKLYDYAESAAGRGLRCLIAGAGGAAHLPGMAAALTPLPVLGVPIQSRVLNGVDSLLSIVQMPAGVPTATFAIGKAGAANAALFAVATLAANGDGILAERLAAFREAQREKVEATVLPAPEPRG